MKSVIVSGVTLLFCAVGGIYVHGFVRWAMLSAASVNVVSLWVSLDALKIQREAERAWKEIEQGEESE